MLLDMHAIKREYETSKRYRELGKWAFALGTFGLGALYLWATTEVIPEGHIGLRESANGKMQLLPPGRHSNFPWESYPVSPKSLSGKKIEMGPYKIITVDTGFVAETYNRGNVEILAVGQHLIREASHTFKGFISTKHETKKLHEVIAATRDNVGLTLNGDVRYCIQDPAQAVSCIAGIDESIKEIAEISIARIVSGHNLQDFVPVSSGANYGAQVNSVLHEIVQTVTAQLQELGIRLITLGITGWKINDAHLSHELAQGAVISSQTKSRSLAADNAAIVKITEARASAEAIGLMADAEANAILVRGRAYQGVVRSFEGNPMMMEVYKTSQQVEMVKGAKNPNLFFAQGSERCLPPVVATLPAVVNQLEASRL